MILVAGSPEHQNRKAAQRLTRDRDRAAARKALRPAPKHENETVVALWRSGLFDTVEIAARTGLSESAVDRIISADLNARHDEERRG